MHAEQVRALHVVGQQYRAGHDDELEEEHVGAKGRERWRKKKRRGGKRERELLRVVYPVGPQAAVAVSGFLKVDFFKRAGVWPAALCALLRSSISCDVSDRF